MSRSVPVLVVLDCSADAVRVQAALQGLGLWSRPVSGARGDRALVIERHSAAVAPERLLDVPGVADVMTSASPHPLVDGQARAVHRVGPAAIGGAPVLVAGPCAVESEEQIREAAQMAVAAGARLLRGGAFKPRTSPYAFRGHGERALRWLVDAARSCGLGVVTEVMSEQDASLIAEVADLVQVGSRSMASFALLRAVGRTGRPVLLKRGMSATVEEWLLAGEHLLDAGAASVIFCERGIAGGDGTTRNLLDLGAVALLAHVHGQAVMVDPSHALGRRDLIAPLARAALAAGACGVLIEAHPRPCEARSDGPQALSPDELTALGRALLGDMSDNAGDPRPSRTGTLEAPR